MCRWALMAMLVAAAPADGAQVIAPRDVAAALRGRRRRPRLRREPQRATGLRDAARRAPAHGPAGRSLRLLARADALERRRPRRRRGRRRRRQRRDRGQRARGARRSVRAVAFGPGGRLGRALALSAPGARADFAASAVAPSGAAIVVWFRHGAPAGAWRPRRVGRDARASARPGALGLRAPPVLHERVRFDRGARRRRRDMDVDRAPRGMGGLRAAGQRFHAPRLLARDASDAPRVVVGDGGAVALTYSTQHVPLARPTGCSCAGRPRRARSVRPRTSTRVAG